MFEKNLKYYRLKKNMSMKDLAEAVGVTPMAISNYEAGKRNPEIEVINKMAAVLGVKVVDFLSRRNENLSFNHCEFRKNSTLSKGQQEFVREAVEEYFSRFFDAVDFLGGDPIPKPPQCHTLKISGDYQKDALILREHIGLSLEGPVDEIITVLENKGILVMEIDIENDKFSGMNGFVNEYPYIVINKNITPERQRTTIVHELAHLMFIWDDENASGNEKLATAIAGAFLITKADLFRELGPKRTAITRDLALICEEYGISLYLLVKRGAQVGIISAAVERDFYIRANKANMRKMEPPRIKNPEHPLLFKQLVYRAVNEEGISIQKGAELLDSTYAEVARYCGLMEVGV